MEKRKLGQHGPEVPVLCLGGNVYGWTLPEAGAFRQLDRAVAAGLNFIDTADMYSRWVPGHQGGESESILGNWLKKSGRRREVLIATKLGLEMGEGKSGLGAKYIAQAVDDSLRRLQTDYIDLYQAHTDDANTPLEETLAAFDKLVKAGKVRAIGASNYTGARLAEALETSRKNGLVQYVSIQPHYNLVARRMFETELLPVVQKYQIGAIPYYAIAAGFLTGKYRRDAETPATARAGGVEKYRTAEGYAVIDALRDVAAQHNAAPASVALAWLSAQPGVTAPIVSATDDKQLDEIIAAASLKLDQASRERLAQASAPFAA